MIDYLLIFVVGLSLTPIFVFLFFGISDMLGGKVCFYCKKPRVKKKRKG